MSSPFVSLSLEVPFCPPVAPIGAIIAPPACSSRPSQPLCFFLSVSGSDGPQYADPVFVSADVNDLPQYGAKIRYIPTFAFFSARGQKASPAERSGMRHSSAS